MNVDAVRLVVQLALGGVFLLSAAGKLRSPVAFLRGVAEYEILPNVLAYALGALLIPVEALLALAYLSGWQLRTAAPLGVAVLLVFAVAVTVTLVRNRDVRCHCFGSLQDERVSARSLVQLLLLVAGASFVWSGAGGASSGLASGRMDVVPALTWALALLLAGVWLLRAGEVARLLRPYRCRSCSQPPDAVDAPA